MFPFFQYRRMNVCNEGWSKKKCTFPTDDSHKKSINAVSNNPTNYMFFIGPESDHCLPLSVTDWLTDSVAFSTFDWCDPGMWRCQFKTCWCWYCCWLTYRVFQIGILVYTVWVVTGLVSSYSDIKWTPTGWASWLDILWQCFKLKLDIELLLI